MAKKLLVRMYHGYSVTVVVCLLVQMLTAYFAGQSVTPAFAARFGNEAFATLFQLMLVGLIGAAFAGSAVVFENPRWSFLKQGILHFLITAAVWMPIAWFCWAPVKGAGLAWTILGWTLTYIINWLVQYIIARRAVKELNRRIDAKRA